MPDDCAARCAPCKLLLVPAVQLDGARYTADLAPTTSRADFSLLEIVPEGFQNLSSKKVRILRKHSQSYKPGIYPATPDLGAPPNLDFCRANVALRCNRTVTFAALEHIDDIDRPTG